MVKYTACGRLPGSPSNNHTPNHDSITKQKGGRVGFAALLSAPSSSFRPSDRKPLVRAITVLVLSIVHPSFQPRLNHGKMLHKHFPSIQQPRSNHEPTILRVEYKNDTISTKPSYISDSPTPTDTQKQFNLNHQTKRRARQICRAPRFSHNRVVGSHTAMHTGRRTSPNGELPPRRWSR